MKWKRTKKFPEAHSWTSYQHVIASLTRLYWPLSFLNFMHTCLLSTSIIDSATLTLILTGCLLWGEALTVWKVHTKWQSSSPLCPAHSVSDLLTLSWGGLEGDPRAVTKPKQVQTQKWSHCFSTLITGKYQLQIRQVVIYCHLLITQHQRSTSGITFQGEQHTLQCSLANTTGCGIRGRWRAPHTCVIACGNISWIQWHLME